VPPRIIVIFDTKALESNEKCKELYHKTDTGIAIQQGGKGSRTYNVFKLLKQEEAGDERETNVVMDPHVSAAISASQNSPTKVMRDMLCEFLNKSISTRHSGGADSDVAALVAKTARLQRELANKWKEVSRRLVTNVDNTDFDLQGCKGLEIAPASSDMTVSEKYTRYWRKDRFKSPESAGTHEFAAINNSDKEQVLLAPCMAPDERSMIVAIHYNRTAQKYNAITATLGTPVHFKAVSVLTAMTMFDPTIVVPEAVSKAVRQAYVAKYHKQLGYSSQSKLQEQKKPAASGTKRRGPDGHKSEGEEEDDEDDDEEQSDKRPRYDVKRLASKVSSYGRTINSNTLRLQKVEDYVSASKSQAASNAGKQQTQKLQELKSANEANAKVISSQSQQLSRLQDEVSEVGEQHTQLSATVSSLQQDIQALKKAKTVAASEPTSADVHNHITNTYNGCQVFQVNGAASGANFANVFGGGFSGGQTFSSQANEQSSPKKKSRK